jgi:hypothetical protein
MVVSIILRRKDYDMYKKQKNRINILRRYSENNGSFVGETGDPRYSGLPDFRYRGRRALTDGRVKTEYKSRECLFLEKYLKLIYMNTKIVQ